MNLVEKIYPLTGQFPKSEVYGLSNQMRRAAVSVPSNIAEGHTREHLREYLQHVSIAQGSLAELQTQCEIAVRLGYVTEDAMSETSVALTALAKQLYSLRNALASRQCAIGRTPQHPTPST